MLRAVTAAEEWFQQLIENLDAWRDMPGGIPEATRTSTLAGIEALEAATVITADDADRWRASFERALAREPDPPAEADRESWARNATSTEAELLQVIPGPEDVHGGYRLLLLLRFADGVVCLLDKDGVDADDWPQWTLRDAFGTVYESDVEGGGDTHARVSFHTGTPHLVGWVELRLDGHDDVVFRVMT